jgi:hypothetical protein
VGEPDERRDVDEDDIDLGEPVSLTPRMIAMVITIMVVLAIVASFAFE